MSLDVEFARLIDATSEEVLNAFRGCSTTAAVPCKELPSAGHRSPATIRLGTPT